MNHKTPDHQLRGRSTAQAADVRLAAAHGKGGMPGSRPVAGAVAFGKDQL